MSATLVLPRSMGDKLRRLCSLDVETGAVLLVKIVREDGGSLRLLASELILVPERAYLERTGLRMQITPEGYLPALARARETATQAIWLHTHPGQGSSPKPSELDEVVDAKLGDVFRLRGESDYYGALIFAADEGNLAFSGHLESHQDFITISRLFEVGPRWALSESFEAEQEGLPNLFDRNILAFGSGVQRALTKVQVAIVGCGGHGSAVAEQLVRLGVRNLTLIDGDSLSESNVTRVYGSTPDQVEVPKTEVLATHLRRIAPDVSIDEISGYVTSESIARRLVGHDVVFACTDDNAGRNVLSRFSFYYMTPVIDCGVMISSRDGCIDGIFGRVSVLGPGSSCLVCRGGINQELARAETMTASEYDQRVKEGYAPELGNTEPAVVAFTTLVAATAVSELLERLTGYGPEPVPDEIKLLVHDRRISSTTGKTRPGCYCDPVANKIGLGEVAPFLGMTWGAL